MIPFLLVSFVLMPTHCIYNFKCYIFCLLKHVHDFVNSHFPVLTSSVQSCISLNIWLWLHGPWHTNSSNKIQVWLLGLGPFHLFSKPQDFKLCGSKHWSKLAKGLITSVKSVHRPGMTFCNSHHHADVPSSWSFFFLELTVNLLSAHIKYNLKSNPSIIDKLICWTHSLLQFVNGHKEIWSCVSVLGVIYL